jgi:hypothetical protein
MTKREKLNKVYQLLTSPQKDFFNRLYGSVDNICEKDINWAIIQCENTMKKNTDECDINNIDSFFEKYPSTT